MNRYIKFDTHLGQFENRGVFLALDSNAPKYSQLDNWKRLDEFHVKSEETSKTRVIEKVAERKRKARIFVEKFSRIRSTRKKVNVHDAICRQENDSPCTRVLLILLYTVLSLCRTSPSVTRVVFSLPHTVATQ